MSKVFLARLGFDLAAAVLLLFGLSYWWLGNLAHELAGTAMFLLLILHNVFNRRWYQTLGGTRREPRGLLNVAATFLLFAAMLVLVGTSVLISNALSSVMSPFGGFTVRQIHTLAAYWVLVLVAIHLGFRWPLIMGAARSLVGISQRSAPRTTALRIAAMLIAIAGIWSSFELDVGTKLAMRMTLDWWNFEASVAGFFLRAVAVAGLYIVVTYYAVQLATWLAGRVRQRAR